MNRRELLAALKEAKRIKLQKVLDDYQLSDVHQRTRHIWKVRITPRGPMIYRDTDGEKMIYRINPVDGGSES